MPLRYRIKSNPETVQDIALASEEKYWEGIELLAAGGGDLSAGLRSGNAAPRTHASLRDGARPADFVAPRLDPIRRWAKRQLPSIHHESCHSLWFWVLVLRRKRALLGQRLSAHFDASLLQRVRRLHGIWIVEMRYKPDQAMQREAESVYSDVTWMRDRQSQLVY